MAGEHKIKPLPFAYGALKGISEQQTKFHHDTHYAGYVNKRNEIELALEKTDRSKANANYSEFSELKRRETFCAAGQFLHELYWDNLGGDGTANGKILQRLEKDFGSLEVWKNDFVASAKTCFGWVILALDTTDGKLRNFTSDTHNQGISWGAAPLLVLDMFEHAYYHDYGPDKAKYIEAFLQNINWKTVNSRLEKAMK